jgi:DNA-binding winged helix-turn-helix (wHTH) protein/tetratricopeptide (TPR) repeat protein
MGGQRGTLSAPVYTAADPLGTMSMVAAQLHGRVLRFGPFELDLESQELRKAGAPHRLQPQPFRVLALLVSRAGKVVTREELRRELWGSEVFVDFEQGLNHCIRQIRVALDDVTERPRYVETRPRRGYRFIGPVEGLEAIPPPGGEESGKRWPSIWGRGPKSRALIAVTILGPALIGAAILARLRRDPVFTEKDAILLTEFVNKPGDPSFDGTLRKALSVELGQSPYLNVVSDDTVRETLGFMGKPTDTRITLEIGREVCRRNGIKAILTGGITNLGNQYVITLEALNASSGDTLAEEQATAAGKEQVLNALARASGRLRKKLGESLPSIQNFAKPLEQATTSSLEAFRLYSLALEKRDREGQIASIPFFQRAIQLDPNFALAYARLGTAYANLEQRGLAEEYLKKAMLLNDRVSEREKLYIAAHYYNAIGDKEKEVETYELYSQVYPRDSTPQVNLVFIYSVLGRFDTAVDHALTGLRLAPDSPFIRQFAAQAYAALGRLEEARAVVMEGLKRRPSNSALHLALSNIALAQGDETTRDREDVTVKSTPEGSLNLLYRDAARAASRGQLEKAEGLYARARDTALRLQLKDNAAFAVALQAVYEAYLQYPSRAKMNARRAVAMSQMTDVIVPGALALVLGGEDREAETLISNLAKRRAEDTFVQFLWVPSVRALASLNRGRVEEAIKLLGSADPYDRGNPDVLLYRGIALSRGKRATEAVEQFRRVLALKAGFPYDPACSLAQLGLARAHALAGNVGGSRVAYEDFLALWKDADPEVPILKQAKAEYAALK